MTEPKSSSSTDAFRERARQSEAWAERNDHTTMSLKEQELEAMRKYKIRMRIIWFIGLNMGFAVGGVISDYILPGTLDRFFSPGMILWLSIFAYVCFIAVLVLAPITVIEIGSFSSIDRRHQELKGDGFVQVHDPRLDELTEGLTEVLDKAISDFDAPPQYTRPSTFEAYLKKIIQDLEGQISLADKKASGLLDKGLNYLGMGLFFYVAAIVAWQIWGQGRPIDGLTIAGMISCTVAFVVIEFLAAWCLKQYRGFVDSSLSYARVKSHYDRCLLAYYSLMELSGVDDASCKAREELSTFLVNEASWPDMKQVNSNDFNFMLESMASMTSLVDKVRDVVRASDKKRDGAA